MSEKKLAKIFYSDLWGLREQKYRSLFENDIKTTKWQELEPVSPYYFFVPKDFSLQAEYEKFWKVTDIFKEWSSGVKTHRDHFVVGFTKEELIQKLRVFTGDLPDDLIKESLRLKDTRDWKLREAREEAKQEKLGNRIYPYAYRVFDNKKICYSFSLIEEGCDRRDLMKHFLPVSEKNISLATTRQLSSTQFNHSFVATHITDMCLLSTKTKETSYVFPLYLYPDGSVGAIHDSVGVIRELPLHEKIKTERIPNFTPEFLQAFSAKIGTPVGAGLVPAQKERATTRAAPTLEEIFYYIYAVLYSPTYRKRYEEFLKIDFPRVPLPSNKQIFEKLSNLGKELVEFHLLKHPSLDKTEIGFPKSGSNKVEKITYDESNQKVFLNKDQYFEGIPKEVWEYRIGAYQVMEKYLKDRKGRKLSLDEINHYMKVAKSIRLTIELQERIDDIPFHLPQGG